MHGRTLFDERCPSGSSSPSRPCAKAGIVPLPTSSVPWPNWEPQPQSSKSSGHVLRMPKATLKAHDDLNHAYAFVTSQRFGQVAATVEGLTQALEANGFRTRSRRSRKSRRSARPCCRISTAHSSAASWPNGPRHLQQEGEVLGAATGAVAGDGRLLVVEPDDFLGSGWTLGCDAALTEADFPTRVDVNRSLEVDVNQAGQLTTHWLSDLHQQLSLLARDETMSADGLVSWLDTNISHGRIGRETCSSFFWM